MPTKTSHRAARFAPPCPGPTPSAFSRAMQNTFRRLTPVPILWWPRAAAASSSPMWMATSSSISPSGIAVASTGHCHPEVVAAIQKQAAELIHMSGTDFYYESLVTLAERLSKIAPMPGPHKLYYGNSGAEAIECALKLARYHTKRQNIIAFYGAFHGRTMGALSLTASKPQQRRRFAPLVAGRDARALSRCVPRRSGTPKTQRIRARLRALHRRQAVQDHAAARGSGGDFRRADSGRRRLRGCAHASSCRNSAPHLRPARHSAGGG